MCKTYSFIFESLHFTNVFWKSSYATSDNCISVTVKLNFDLGRVENIAKKGENAGYQHFLLFPQCFEKAFFMGCR